MGYKTREKELITERSEANLETLNVENYESLQKEDYPEDISTRRSTMSFTTKALTTTSNMSKFHLEESDVDPTGTNLVTPIDTAHNLKENAIKKEETGNDHHIVESTTKQFMETKHINIADLSTQDETISDSKNRELIQRSDQLKSSTAYYNKIGHHIVESTTKQFMETKHKNIGDLSTQDETINDSKNRNLIQRSDQLESSTAYYDEIGPDSTPGSRAEPNNESSILDINNEEHEYDYSNIDIDRSGAEFIQRGENLDIEPSALPKQFTDPNMIETHHELHQTPGTDSEKTNNFEEPDVPSQQITSDETTPESLGTEAIHLPTKIEAHKHQAVSFGEKIENEIVQHDDAKTSSKEREHFIEDERLAKLKANTSPQSDIVSTTTDQSVEKECEGHQCLQLRGNVAEQSVITKYSDTNPLESNTVQNYGPKSESIAEPTSLGISDLTDGSEVASLKTQDEYKIYEEVDVENRNTGENEDENRKTEEHNYGNITTEEHNDGDIITMGNSSESIKTEELNDLKIKIGENYHLNKMKGENHVQRDSDENVDYEYIQTEPNDFDYRKNQSTPNLLSSKVLNIETPDLIISDERKTVQAESINSHNVKNPTMNYLNKLSSQLKKSNIVDNIEHDHKIGLVKSSSTEKSNQSDNKNNTTKQESNDQGNFKVSRFASENQMLTSSSTEPESPLNEDSSLDQSRNESLEIIESSSTFRANMLRGTDVDSVDPEENKTHYEVVNEKFDPPMLIDKKHRREKLLLEKGHFKPTKSNTTPTSTSTASSKSLSTTETVASTTTSTPASTTASTTTSTTESTTALPTKSATRSRITATMTPSTTSTIISTSTRKAIQRTTKKVLQSSIKSQDIIEQNNKQNLKDYNTDSSTKKSNNVVSKKMYTYSMEEATTMKILEEDSYSERLDEDEIDDIVVEPVP